MTASTTEQERALADLRHMYAQMVGGMVKDSAQAKRIADGILSRAIQKLEQAARRAPAVPVPQGWKLAPVEPTEEMIKAADDGDDAYTLRAFGHGIRRVMQGPHDHYVAMLAAAPQPPEAAPVELPEPVYTMRVRGRMHDYTPTLSAFDLADGEHELYTGQQVRDLLAAAKVEREPLTDEAIRTLYGESDGHWQMVGPQVLCFARSIEYVHGIQEQST